MLVHLFVFGEEEDLDHLLALARIEDFSSVCVRLYSIYVSYIYIDMFVGIVFYRWVWRGMPQPSPIPPIISH